MPSPISVQPSTTADDPIRQFGPIRTFGPIVALGPTTVPSPISAPGCTMARGSISVTRRSSSSRSASATTCSPMQRDAVDPRQRACGAGRASTSSRSRSPGHDLTPELRVVHAAQVDPHAPAVAHRAAGRSTPGPAPPSSGRPASSADPGKCPWKNSSLTVTFLAATTRRPGSCWTTASSRYQGSDAAGGRRASECESRSRVRQFGAWDGTRPGPPRPAGTRARPGARVQRGLGRPASRRQGR